MTEERSAVMTPGPSAYRLLTRHFFISLFDFGILSDTGTESFKRLLLGALAVVMALGLVLVRMFMGKYAGLASAPALMYQQAVAADHALLMGLSMWLVAVATVLVSHSLFPDDTDFRVLMVQPVSRAVVFAAKLTALLLFVAMVAVGAHAALALLAGLTLLNPHGGPGLLSSLGAHWLASLAASTATSLTVVAVQGMLVLLIPRAGLITAAAAIRSTMLLLLVVALPLVARLPVLAAPYAARVSWLVWVPPAWFVAIERAILRDATHIDIARLGLSVLTIAATVSALTYAVVYRRFDRLTVRPGSGRHSRPRRWMTGDELPQRAVRIAINRFTTMTLGRSVLHQGIVVALLAAGLGVVVNALLVADAPLWATFTSRQREALFWTMVWSLHAWIFVAVPSVRLGLSVPIEPRANWVFRMSEDPNQRVAAIDAAVLTICRIGVLMPMMVLLPGIWLAGGMRVLVVAVVAAIFGWLVTEMHMRDWSSIPFTSSYIPGKGFVPQMFIKGAGMFLAIPAMVTGLVRITFVGPMGGTIFIGIMATAALLLLWRRREHAIDNALSFEDELPMDVNPLRLRGD